MGGRGWSLGTERGPGQEKGRAHTFTWPQLGSLPSYVGESQTRGAWVWGQRGSWAPEALGKLRGWKRTHACMVGGSPAVSIIDHTIKNRKGQVGAYTLCLGGCLQVGSSIQNAGTPWRWDCGPPTAAHCPCAVGFGNMGCSGILALPPLPGILSGQQLPRPSSASPLQLSPGNAEVSRVSMWIIESWGTQCLGPSLHQCLSVFSWAASPVCTVASRAVGIAGSGWHAPDPVHLATMCA